MLPIDQLLPHYPMLAAVQPELRDAVLSRDTRRQVLPAGQVLFEEGQPCQGFPLLTRGELRVARGSPKGRSLELYRVRAGEICVASTCCLFGNRPLMAHAEAVRPTSIVMLSAAGFEALNNTLAFRHFVFGMMADRMSDLMALTEAVAFQRLDQRLATALLGRGEVVQVTHQALADELGTVREIVTRLLHRFERAGWLRLRRERIEIVDAAALRQLAAG